MCTNDDRALSRASSDLHRRMREQARVKFPHPLYGYLRKGTAKKICNGARNVSS